MSLRNLSGISRFTRSRRILSLISSALATFPAHAVNVSTDGTGQVNLIPFYSTRAGHVTSFTITNQNRLHSKVIKVRFREALMGVPVLDLNVFLAPRDVWSASISDNGNGARLSSEDVSCTVPTLPATGVDFVNYYYSSGQMAGTFDDGRGRTLDRTREGYVEVIEMGVVADGADAAASPATATGLSVASTMLQSPNPSNRNCGALQRVNPFPQAGDLLAPLGELSASAILIQIESGTEYVIPVTALQRFFVPADRTADLYTQPGSLKPDLASVSPARSDVPNPALDGPPMLTVEDWIAAGGEAIDAVSAVLMKPALMVPHDLSAGGLRSEIVQVLPTFYGYVKRLPGFIIDISSRAPFARPGFDSSGSAAPVESCMKLQAEPSSRDGAGFLVPFAAIEPRQSPAPNLPINACSAVVRIHVAADDASVLMAPLLGSGPALSALKLPPSSEVPNRFNQGWIALHAGSAPGNAAANTSGITIQTMDLPVYGMVVRGIALQQEGGLGNLAPVHTDGVARRYRGLPMIGFSAIRAVTGGQGYGGAFVAQGRSVPLP